MRLSKGKCGRHHQTRVPVTGLLYPLDIFVRTITAYLKTLQERAMTAAIHSLYAYLLKHLSPDLDDLRFDLSEDEVLEQLAYGRDHRVIHAPSPDIHCASNSTNEIRRAS